MRSLFCLLTLIAIAGCAEKQAVPVTNLPNASADMAESAKDSLSEVTEVVFNATGAPTVAINVPAMMCPHGCAPKVHEALAAQPGVLDVKVVYETKTATVAVGGGEFNANAAIAVLEEEYGFADSSLVETVVAPEADATDAPEDSAKVEG